MLIFILMVLVEERAVIMERSSIKHPCDGKIEGEWSHKACKGVLYTVALVAFKINDALWGGVGQLLLLCRKEGALPSQTMWKCHQSSLTPAFLNFSDARHPVEKAEECSLLSCCRECMQCGLTTAFRGLAVLYSVEGQSRELMLVR